MIGGRELLAGILARRAERRQRIVDAILAAFEVTGEGRDRVRATLVVEVVSHVDGRNLFDPALHREVERVVVDLGGRSIHPGNRRYFRGVRARGGEPAAG